MFKLLVFILLQTGGAERSSGDGAENGRSDERSDDRGSGGGSDDFMQESETINVRLIQPQDGVGCILPSVCMVIGLGVRTNPIFRGGVPQYSVGMHKIL